VLSAVGLIYSYLVWTRTPHKACAYGVFFFTCMEILQTVQYIFIAPSLDSPICDTPINKFLTILGMLHLCLQPYVAHAAAASLVTDEKEKERYVVIKRLCFIAAGMMFSRFVLAGVWDQKLIGPSTEWMRGEKLCTFNGKYHLAWSVPMTDATYMMQGLSLHYFLMFIPGLTFYENLNKILRTIFVIVTGPILAAFITSDVMEQPSIWCLFSIAQIIALQFSLRKIVWAEHYNNAKVPPKRIKRT